MEITSLQAHQSALSDAITAANNANIAVATHYNVDNADFYNHERLVRDRLVKNHNVLAINEAIVYIQENT